MATNPKYNISSSELRSNKDTIGFDPFCYQRKQELVGKK